MRALALKEEHEVEVLEKKSFGRHSDITAVK
jgi:hypothetical protein